MYRSKKRSSIAMVMLMVVSLFAGMSFPNVSASEVVMTDAIEVTPDGAFSDRMVSVDADSQGNTHFVWSRNTQHLYYKMLDPRGEVLIDDTKISNAGAHRAWHPDIRVDHNDMVHITWTDKAGQWTIMYTLIDPSLDDQNGINRPIQQLQSSMISKFHLIHKIGTGPRSMLTQQTILT